MRLLILHTFSKSHSVTRSANLRGLWLLTLLLASFFGTNPARAAQQVEIYNLSLRFHSSTAAQAGHTWRLDLTSGSDEVPANGELALAEGSNEFTHSGFFFLFDPFSSRTDYYAINLSIPTDDLDGNGMFDVLEEGAVASVHTSGSYAGTDNIVHSIRATWNKAAGANAGVCTLEFPDVPLTFETDFENIHYSGAYDYAKTGSSLTGPIDARRNGAAQSTLTGPLNLQIVSSSLLAWGSGQLLTETGATLSYEGSDLDRTALREYSAFYVTADGDLTTPLPDYQTWLLVFPNIADADNNGTPDLIEGGNAESAPRLTLKANANALTLIVTGGQGRTFNLESKSTLSATDPWTKIATLTFATDSESVPVAFSSNAAAFWRLKQ
jgi:hypothetical protein